jgi:putative ABC transport system permease protein
MLFGVDGEVRSKKDLTEPALSEMSGIVEHGKSARLFVLLPTLQEMVGAHDKASLFLIKCDRSNHAVAVQNEVKGLLPGYEVRLPKDFLALLTTSNVPFLGTFINVMISIAVVVGFLVTFLSLYTTVIERTREIGVLKALGASKSYIVWIILSETTLLCIVGIVAGVVLSYGLQYIIHVVYPSLPIKIYARLDWACCIDCSRRRTSRCGLSRLDRQP